MAGGSIELLRSFINVKSDGDFVLLVAWLVAALRNRGPYPLIVLSGEQGSAKSTFSAVLRALVDPNTAPLRALPRSEHDLFIAASNAHVLAFDNVSEPCRRGCPMRCAGSLPVGAWRFASSTLTRTRCCSMLPRDG